VRDGDRRDLAVHRADSDAVELVEEVGGGFVERQESQPAEESEEISQLRVGLTCRIAFRSFAIDASHPRICSSAVTIVVATGSTASASRATSRLYRSESRYFRTDA
jgi:hypothetical protein